MNPLDMTGPEFLGLYVFLLAVAVAMAAALRRGMRSPHDDPRFEAKELDPFEVAYLAGGDRLAADAAIASLVQRRAVTVNPARRTIEAAGPLPPQLHALERAVAPDPKDGQSGLRITTARWNARRTLGEIRDHLRSLGLLIDDGAAWSARLVPIAPVLLLGLAKIQVGLDRHKPVGFLGILCLITVAIGIGFLAVRPHRSRWGDRVLEGLRRGNAALGVTGTRRGSDLSGQDLALAMALFGTGVLVGGPLDDLRAVLVPPSTSSDGGGGGGDGGGGGGGGGGGCGGCGGGG